MRERWVKVREGRVEIPEPADLRICLGSSQVTSDDHTQQRDKPKLDPSSELSALPDRTSDICYASKGARVEIQRLVTPQVPSRHFVRVPRFTRKVDLRPRSSCSMRGR